MGYKVLHGMSITPGVNSFHLNHVGYKVESIRNAVGDKVDFHLNHVGYKASEEAVVKTKEVFLSSEPCGI